MITAAIIIAIFVLIALLRFGVDAEYSADGPVVKAKAGPFSILLFPRKPKPDKAGKEERRKAKKKKKKKKKEKPKKKKPGGLQMLLDMLPPVRKALSRIRRRLLINKLTIYYTAGGDDPAMTALSFGAANAVFDAMAPVLENSFRIRRRDFRAIADFQSGEQAVYVNAAISLAVWEALYIAFALLPVIIGGLKGPTVSTERKEEKKDGKAPDK